MQQLPNLTAVRMGPYSTAKAQWDQVHSEFTVKSVYVQNDLESLFHEMQCVKGGNVCIFLTSLWYQCKELTAAGISVSAKDSSAPSSRVSQRS